eukprot:SAG31_NODE_862_length_11416_cov_8.600336_1_plen_166_part_00
MSARARQLKVVSGDEAGKPQSAQKMKFLVPNSVLFSATCKALRATLVCDTRRSFPFLPPSDCNHGRLVHIESFQSLYLYRYVSKLLSLLLSLCFQSVLITVPLISVRQSITGSDVLLCVRSRRHRRIVANGLRHPVQAVKRKRRTRHSGEKKRGYEHTDGVGDRR